MVFTSFIPIKGIGFATYCPHLNSFPQRIETYSYMFCKVVNDVLNSAPPFT